MVGFGERYCATALLEAQRIYDTTLGAGHERAVGLIESLVDLYETWHEADPDNGHEAKSTQWRRSGPGRQTKL